MTQMKSTRIHVNNVPKVNERIRSVHLKPIGALITILCIGIVLLFFGRASLIFGIWLMSLALVGLILMPDRLLFSYCDEFLIFHDRHDQNICQLLYWQEISSWQYVRGKTYDQLIVKLEDDSVCTTDAYSRRKTVKIMNRYCPGKEIRNGKGRR